MTLKDILVHLDDSEACKSRLAAAIAVAQTYQARLTGIYAYPEFPLFAYAEVPVPAELVQAQAEDDARRAAEAERAFNGAVKNAGIEFEWRLTKGETVRVVNLNARYADLVITGQAEDKETGWLELAVTENVAIGSGRPVLAIPYFGAHKTIGERIVVAWNESREAVRAVNDALPFLERAEMVKVMAISPKRDKSGHGEIACADICLHLARHGVKAEAYEVSAGDIDVADMLLSRAADDAADLIVMGAYGHTRFRELVLGGVTRHILRHMTVPVLMSH